MCQPPNLRNKHCLSEETTILTYCVRSLFWGKKKKDFPYMTVYLNNKLFSFASASYKM